MIDSAEITRWEGLCRSVVSDYFPPPGLDRDDLMQEARIGVYEAIRDYRPARGRRASFIGLCVRRQVQTALLAAHRGKHSPLNDAITVLAGSPAHLSLVGDPDPSETAHGSGLIRALFAACWSLSDLELRVFELLVAGHSYDEVAAEIKTDYKTVDNAWQRATHKLRDALERDGWELAA